jgi:hypothetical protein
MDLENIMSWLKVDISATERDEIWALLNKTLSTLPPYIVDFLPGRLLCRFSVRTLLQEVTRSMNRHSLITWREVIVM